MKSYLFPAYFKKVGVIMFIPFAVLLIGSLTPWELMDVNGKMFAIRSTGFMEKTEYFTWVDTSITFNLGLIGVLISLLFAAFARERIEDEFVTKIREQSLVWAVMVNYGLILLVFLFIFGYDVIYCIFANTYTLLILFIIKFNVAMHRSRKIQE